NWQSTIDEPLVDLTRDEQEFVLCRGGAGGKGNVHFKSSRNRAPRQYTEGEEGEQGYFLFELRTIADAGLVGCPTAGKWTVARACCRFGGAAARKPTVQSVPVVASLDCGCQHNGFAGCEAESQSNARETSQNQDSCYIRRERGGH